MIAGSAPALGPQQQWRTSVPSNASSRYPAAQTSVAVRAWTESDMLERQLLGRSLLGLGSTTRARLTFEGSSNQEQPWAKLLNLVSSLVEGTDQADVTFALGSSVVAAPAIAAPPAASERAVPQVAA